MTASARTPAEVSSRLSLMEGLASALRDGALAVGKNGAVTFHNRELRALWEIEADAIDGMDEAAFFRHVASHAENPEEVMRSVAGLADTPDVISRGEIRLSDGRTVEHFGAPLMDPTGDTIEGRVWFFRDITEERLAAEELARVNDSLVRHNDALSVQQETIRRLSAPVLRIWDRVVAVPIIGALDAERITALNETVTNIIVRDQCEFVLVDVTGVETLDTGSAAGLLKIAQAVRILGSECFLTGMSPNVAQTVVTLEIDLSAFRTSATLEEGLRAVMTALEDKKRRRADRERRKKERENEAHRIAVEGAEPAGEA